jgi:DNA-binding PadR family transcriptional regulator
MEEKMEKEVNKILSKLIEKRKDGVGKKDLPSGEKFKEILSKLIKDGFAKSEKVGRGEKFFITEKGEIEFIKRMEKDSFENFVKDRINDLQSEIKKLNENLENLIKILSIKKETLTKFGEKVNLFDEIYRVYKELSTKNYSYLAGLVPIPSIVSSLIQRYGVSVQEVHNAIYNLFLKDEILLEYGDKKEGNLVTPDGKSYYYLKFKK